MTIQFLFHISRGTSTCVFVFLWQENFLFSVRFWEWKWNGVLGSAGATISICVFGLGYDCWLFASAVTVVCCWACPVSPHVSRVCKLVLHASKAEACLVSQAADFLGFVLLHTVKGFFATQALEIKNLWCRVGNWGCKTLPWMVSALFWSDVAALLVRII